MAPQSERRVIEVRVDAAGANSNIKKLADDFAKMNGSIKKSSDILGSLRNAFFAIQGLSFAGIGVGQIVSAADAMQKLTDRLTLSEGSATKAKAALSGIVIVANQTKSSIEDVALIYNRLNLSLGETGISSDALLGLTTALQNSFRLSGSTAAEATAATIQLSQGLAAGQLRGQELRSVLEANALAGDILAKAFKTTRGELLKFSEANGGLDAGGVIRGFAEAAQDLTDRAAVLKPTISEGLTVAFNDLKLKLLDVNEQIGGTDKALKLIKITFDNLGSIALAVAGLTLWAKGAAIAAFATSSLATGLGLLTGPLVSLTILFSPLYLGATLAVGAIVALGAGIIALAVDFDGVIGKGKEFLTWLGILAKQKSDVDKMKESWFAATSEQNNYVTSAKKGGRVLEENLNPAMGSFAKSLIVASSNMANIGPMERHIEALKDFSASGAISAKTVFDFDAQLSKLNKQFSQDKDIAKYKAALKSLQIQEIDEKFAKGKLTLEEYNKKLSEIKFGKAISSLKEMRGELAEVNAQFRTEVAAGSVSGYAKAVSQINMNKLNADLKTGKVNLLEVNKQMRDISIANYSRELANGTVSLKSFREASQASNLAQLNQDWRSGAIDVYAYNKAITETQDKFSGNSAMFTGINNYIQSAGTLSQNVSNAITNTFGNLENSMLDFIKTGKFNFRDFAASIIEDLNRIIIRSMIIRPLAQGILGAIPSGGGMDRAGGTTQASSDYLAMKAKGAAYTSSGTEFFAKGGVVSSTTPFGYGKGKMGIMGEKGPEAILPLKRDGAGNLGVSSGGAGSNVIINITNTTDGQVEQKESTGPNGQKVIDILIGQKVKEAFASGSMDKMMSQSYGLRRKGQ